MRLRFTHEVVAPGLHRFRFASQTRPGLQHELWLDLDGPAEDRLACLCDAGLHGRFCKHKRFIVSGAAPVPGLLRPDHEA